MTYHTPGNLKLKFEITPPPAWKSQNDVVAPPPHPLEIKYFGKLSCDMRFSIAKRQSFIQNRLDPLPPEYQKLCYIYTHTPLVY